MDDVSVGSNVKESKSEPPIPIFAPDGSSEIVKRAASVPIKVTLVIERVVAPSLPIVTV